MCNGAVWMWAAGRGRYLDVAKSGTADGLELRIKIQLRDSKIKVVK